MAQAKQTTATAGFTTLAELSQESSLAAFRLAMQAGQATEKLAYDMMAANMASHEAAYKASKEFANATNRTRQEYVKKSAEVAEKMLSVTLTAGDYPFRKEVEELQTQMVENTKKVFDFFTTPVATAATR